MTQTPKEVAITSARTRLSAALREQARLATASSCANLDPGLDADYQRAVAAVAAADTDLQKVMSQ